MKKLLLISCSVLGLAACNSPLNSQTTIGSCSDYSTSLVSKSITKDNNNQDDTAAGSLIWSYNADKKELTIEHIGMCGACDDSSYYETAFELYEDGDCYKLLEQQVKKSTSSAKCGNCRRNLELKAVIENNKICLNFTQVPLDQEEQLAWSGDLDLTEKSGIIAFENKSPLLCTE